MMKKILTLFLALAASVGTLFAKTYSGTCGTNLTWTLDTESGILTISGTGAMKNYSSSTVPWYSSRSSIKTVIIEDGVTSIGNCALYECSKLTSITIPNSVTSIGERAFRNCSSLTSITIPNSVTNIGESAFGCCSSLTSITIPNSVTSIGNYAFYECSGLTAITIPNSVTSIREHAFYGCSSLTSITIPNSVKSIGTNAFSNCKIDKIYFSGTMEEWCTKSFFPYSISSSYTLYINGEAVSNAVIPNSVTSIGTYAFSNCRSLASITIPNSVTSIGTYAFYNCSKLTSVTIGESVTSIGEDAFKGCSKLATVNWNAKKYNDFSSSNTPFYYYNSYSSSTSNNFDLRKQITSFTFGDKVEYIPAYLCAGMSNLTSIIIPNSVTSIVAYAFRDCSSLTSVTIGESVTSIGSSAFLNCSSLTSVHISDIAAWCKIAFYSSISNPLYYTHNLYLNGTLVTDLVIPDGVTSIKSYAFYGCSNLTSLTIPNSVTSIGGSAFYGCTYLEDITIGSDINVENGIGQNAFYGCRYLLSVTCKAVYPPAINANVFEGCGVLGGVDLYVPENSVARYKKADVWSEFNIVGKDLSVDDPTNPTNPEDGKYTITWQDEDGNVIRTDEVTQGTTPAFTGTTPTKPATNEYTYEFAGWLPKIKAATENAKYITFFERNKIETPVYTVNINGENCSLNINNQYPEGSVITLEAVADECFEFRQWSDGNKDNPRTITITANTNLTAEFNKVRYTVTGQPSTGGKVQIRKQ